MVGLLLVKAFLVNCWVPVVLYLISMCFVELEVEFLLICSILEVEIVPLKLLKRLIVSSERLNESALIRLLFVGYFIKLNFF